MEQIIERMEHLPKDPRIDNPLKITNDARKAGLDYRLIDPEAGDYDGSKSNAVVERIFQIWQDTTADKGTQLVFCDLSTPKSGAGVAAPTPAAGLEFVEEDFFPGADSEDTAPAAGSDEEGAGDSVEAGDDDGADNTVSADMDACVAAGSRFSVYEDMRQKLMERGIPAEEIAFTTMPIPTSAKPSCSATCRLAGARPAWLHSQDGRGHERTKAAGGRASSGRALEAERP